MTVIAVGHTHTKFSRLLKSIPDSFDVIKVFNGDDHREDGSIIVPNDLNGRDVAMYAEGLKHTDSDRLVFLNDDVQHIHEDWWKLADMFLNKWEHHPDLIGSTNMSSWVDYNKLPNEKEVERAKKQGRDPLFVRTSAFMCTRQFFTSTWEKANGSAQAFEKSTLKEAGRVHVIPAQWCYDSNVRNYV